MGAGKEVGVGSSTAAIAGTASAEIAGTASAEIVGTASAEIVGTASTETAGTASAEIVDGIAGGMEHLGGAMELPSSSKTLKALWYGSEKNNHSDFELTLLALNLCQQ